MVLKFWHSLQLTDIYLLKNQILSKMDEKCECADMQMNTVDQHLDWFIRSS